MSGERFFDDLRLGERFAAGPSAPITADEIVAFANLFDPQPLHNDPEAARALRFEGLIASGWHTVGVVMRLWIELRPLGGGLLLGRGVDELRWPHPVQPGDALRLEAEVVELLPSSSRPQGIVRVAMRGINQHGRDVLTMVPSMVVPRRMG